MKIDVRTLILIIGICYMMQVLVFFYQYKTNKFIKGPGWWLMWSVAELIGFLIILLRGFPLLLPWVIAFQNITIILGTILIYIGVLKFFDRKINLKFILSFFIIFVVLHLSFYFIKDDFYLRTLLLNSTLSGIGFLTAITIFKNKIHNISSTANFNIVLFLIHGSVFGYRTVMLILGTYENNLFAPTFYNLTQYFDAFILSLLWTFGFIIMLNQRLNSEISESKSRFEQIFNTNPDSALITRLNDGMLVDCNDSFTKIFGYSKDDILGKTKLEINFWKNPTDRQEFTRIIKENGVYENHELLFQRKDGIVITGLMSAKVIMLNGIPHIINVSRDITDRKQVERKFRESEEKFRNLFETMPNGFYRSTPDGYFVDANPAFVKMLGYDSKEELLKVYIPTDVYVKPEEREVFARENTEFVNNLEAFRLKTKDGRIIWIEENAKYIKDESGKIIFHEGICRDITDRKQAEEKLLESEEKLSTLFGSMTEMVVLHELVFNDNGKVINYRITDCNNSFTKIIGIQKEDAIGKLATDVYQTETPPYLEEYSRVAQTGEPFDYTTYFVPMDKHFMISAVSPKKNHFATITTDITVIKQMQEIMSTKKNELENYLYVASHDLRSPLVNIQGFSKRLEKQTDKIKTILDECKLDDEIQASLGDIIGEGLPKTINYILSNVNKMDSLIHGLLQISRTGRIKMDIKKIDMNQLLKTIITSNNYQLSEISAKVIIDDLPDCYGDENQLNQLFSNIIGNAIKYRNKTKQLVINISGHVQYNKVIYSIKDNGIGIAQKYLEKIWDVFFRIDSNSSEAGEGIGLSLAKRITDKHNGKIWVESEEGEGSNFYIELQKNEFTE